MGVVMMGIGSQIKCTDLEFINGAMAEFTKESMSEDWNADKVHTPWRMEENTSALGRMAFKKELACLLKMEKLNKGNGKMEKGLNG